MKKNQFLFLTCFLLLSEISFSQRNQSELNLEHTAQVLSTEISKIIKETGIPSISISLIKNDTILWSAAFGFANVKKQIPATSSTIYSTGSTFKFVTATAIMQLAERGKLDIDDPINNYLEEFKIKDLSSQGTPVTFRHLLSHHSGLEGSIQIVPLWNRKLPRTLEEIPSEITAVEPPGRNYNYCNHCYALAGLVIEKLSGKSFEEYIIENILKPLQINSAGPIVPTPEMVEELALPYSLKQNKPVPEHQSRFDVFPAGDAYLRSDEMANFLIAQMNNGIYNGQSILSPASIAEMHEPQFESNYGLGTRIVQKDNRKFLEHTGSVPGFSTFFKVETDSDVGVYIASNADGVQDALEEIANLAIELMSGNL